MLPEGITIKKSLETKQPSKTWKIDFSKNKIANMIDNLEAVKQMIHLALTTEYRYSDIYTDFGLKTTDIIGQDFFFIVSEFKRRIRETLLKDDRISDVTDFFFEEIGDGILVSFTVLTIYGEIESEEVISV